MKYRKLRIAFSVACGIACLLLIVLWVRSYWWWDIVDYHPGPSTLYVAIARFGVLEFENASERLGMLITPPPVGWSVDHWYFAGLQGDYDSNIWGESFRRKFSMSAFPAFGRPDPNQLRVPIWFFVLVSAALASVPWLRWRYSLRTLLVAMTLAAVGLGAVGLGAVGLGAVVYLAR